MLKLSRTMSLMLEYEREKRQRYHWVVSMRSDYNLEAPGHNTMAPNVLGVIRSGAIPGLIRMKPFFGSPGLFESSYGQADWFWMALRQDAEAVAFFVPNVTCEWLRCIGASARNIQNERLMVEWLLKHGKTVANMPPGGFRSPGPTAAPNSPYRTQLKPGLIPPKECDAVP